MPNLTKENAYIFRITHIDNVPWLLSNGVHCRNSQHCDPNFREIGNPDLISRRSQHPVPVTGGTLSDYVPFYFTSFSPMLLNIKTGYNSIPKRPMSEIVILVSSIPKLVDSQIPFVFTDRHAYLAAAQFSSDPKDLDRIDWKILAARDFKRDPNDPGKMERYQAEALVRGHVPVSALIAVLCYDAQRQAEVSGQVSNAGVSLQVAARHDWYF